MRAMWFSQIIVAGTGLFRKWRQSGCNGTKRSSSDLIQHSRGSSTSESYVSTASSFAPDSGDESFRKRPFISKRSCMRLFRHFSDERRKRSGDIIKVKKSFHIKPKGLDRKRRRSHCCGLSSLKLDLEEGNLSRVRNPKKVGEVDEPISRAGKPSKGSYTGSPLRNMKDRPFFPHNEENRLIMHSESNPTLYSFDPVLLDQVDHQQSEAFPGFDKNDIETATKELSPGGLKDHAMDEQNCNLVQSILSLASEKSITLSGGTSSPVDLPAKLTLVEEGVPRVKAGSVAKIGAAAERHKSVKHLNLVAEKCANKDPKKNETIEEPAKLPKLMPDTFDSCATQNHCVIQDLNRTKENMFKYPANEYSQNSSEQILPGNKDRMINRDVLDATGFQSKTQFHDVLILATNKSFDHRNAESESWISDTTSVSSAFQLERKRKLHMLLNPPLQVNSSRQEEISGDYAKVKDGTHSDVLNTSSSSVAVHMQDKEALLSVHGKKRKSEACLETISSYPTAFDMSTGMQTEKSTLSEKEQMFFEFGVEAGLMLMLSSSHTRIHRLHQSWKKSVDMVADLRHELDSNRYLLPHMHVHVQHRMDEKPCSPGTLRKQQISSQISDSKLETSCTTILRNHVDYCEVGDEDSDSEVSVLTVDHTPQGGDMTELEKELQAELELLELNFNGGNLNDDQERLSGLSVLDSKGIGGLLHRSQTSSNLCQSPGPNGSNIDLCKHIVSPLSLDNGLEHAKENQGVRIMELEAQMSEAKKLLQSKEREILWWKDCASHLTEQQYHSRAENVPEEIVAAIEEIETKRVPDKNSLGSDLSSLDLDKPLLKSFASEDAFPLGIKCFNFPRWVDTSDSIPTFQGAVNLAADSSGNELLECLGSIKDQKGDVYPSPTNYRCKDGNKISQKQIEISKKHQRISAIEDCMSKMCNEDSDCDSERSCISSCSSLVCTKANISLRSCT